MAVATTIGICVPTIRDASIRRFIAAWAPHWTNAPEGRVILFVYEDRAVRTFALPASPGLRVEHTSHEDIPRVLGKDEWIIPRGSGACRSFPMYLAWQSGAEYIVTLDDDCLPDGENGQQFLATHLAAFARDRWFRTMAGDEPRGIP